MAGKSRTTWIVLSYKNTKLEKEREKEEVYGRYLSTFACTSVTQVNTKPSCLRLKTEPWHKVDVEIDKYALFRKLFKYTFLVENDHYLKLGMVF
jgi:hypothetical protein